jgi:hypothetical protein
MMALATCNSMALDHRGLAGIQSLFRVRHGNDVIPKREGGVIPDRYFGIIILEDTIHENRKHNS